MNPHTSAECLLALFFTRGVSLRQWAESGLLSREVALYRELAQHGIRTVFFSYGGIDDFHFAEQLPVGSQLCVNRWCLPQSLYERLLPLIHWNVLRKVAIIKSNQTYGGHVALSAARRWRKPFVARSGYLWSDFVSRAHGKDSFPAKQSISYEEKVLRGASRIVVATAAMMDSIRRRIPDAAGVLKIIPNYVDTELFSPGIADPKGALPRISFVGRLDPQKTCLHL